MRRSLRSAWLDHALAVHCTTVGPRSSDGFNGVGTHSQDFRLGYPPIPSTPGPMDALRSTPAALDLFAKPGAPERRLALPCQILVMVAPAAVAPPPLLPFLYGLLLIRSAAWMNFDVGWPLGRPVVRWLALLMCRPRLVKT